MTINRKALAILTTIPLLGSMKIRLLINHFGSAEAILEASHEELKNLSAHLPGFNERHIHELSQWKVSKAWRENEELIDKHAITLVPYDDPSYPQGLLELRDFPALLYVAGSLIASDERSLAIVGTRIHSIYGGAMAEKMGEELARIGFTIVSGLARGIDTYAHKGALRGGRTVAVLGSGIANLYPAENKRLASQIEENGAVISEFPMKMAPDRTTFPQRNRIVSGMTLGAVLIEAPLKSGAMITMEKGKSQGRPLFALPGRADVESFKGNHSLIKRGLASLVEGAEDVSSHFNGLFGNILFSGQKSAPPLAQSLEPEEVSLLKAMPSEERTIDELVESVQIPVGKLNVLLMSLVIKKMVKEYPGKIYKKY